MVAQKLADADLAWFEEPCGSYNDGGNLLVQQLGLMPIAGGESLKSRYEFAERLASHMFDIIQPDIVSAGGVSEMFKLRSHGKRLWYPFQSALLGNWYQLISDTACGGLSSIKPTLRLSRTIYQSIRYGV